MRNESLRTGVELLGAHRAVDPEAVEEHGPVRRDPGAGRGRRTWPTTSIALATGGRIVIIGVGAGAKAELNLLALMGKRGTIRASTLRARPLEEKAIAMREVEKHVLPLFDDGTLSVPVAASFPLDEVEAAYDRFAEGGKLGKVVLTMG